VSVSRIAEHNPNFGIGWYLFMLSFQEYVILNAYIYNVFMVFMAISASIYMFKLWRVSKYGQTDAMFFTLVLGFLNALGPYGSMYDLPLFVALMSLRNGYPLSPTSVKIGLLTSTAFIATSSAMYYIWIHRMGGNGNYLFFQCLAYCLFIIPVFADILRQAYIWPKQIKSLEKLAKSK